MAIPLRLLIIEDSVDDADLLVLALQRGGYDVQSKRVQTAEAMREALGSSTWDIIISDYTMPTFSALDALAVLKESKLDIPVIVVSGTVGEETAVKAMKSGAQDYLMKNHFVRLLPAVRRELEEAAERIKARAALEEKEEQLMQSQKLEAIGSLAGGIAHDFNNVLGAVMLFCDAARDELDDKVAVQGYLNQIEKAAEHAAILTKQLLTYSRKNALDQQVDSLNEIVNEFERLLRRLVSENIDFEINLGATKKVYVNRSHIGQMIVNLVVNARDAMPKGGELRVETTTRRVDSLQFAENGQIPLGTYTVLSVRDTGCGMDEKIRSRIFEPFFTTKGVGRGTGLGLPTVYGIVVQNSGYICVESKVNVGTLFEIYLPIVDTAQADEIPSKKMRSMSPSGRTVLVVEDQAPLRSSISAALKRKGYESIEATNGQEALEKIKKLECPVDLIITDIVMPEMNGTDLAIAARAHWKDVKVLFMSGYADDVVLASGANLKYSDGFLEKPFSSAALLEKVGQALSGRKG